MIHHKFCPDANIGWVSTVKDEDFQEAVRKVAGGVDALVVFSETWVTVTHHIDLKNDLILMSAKLKRFKNKPTQSLWSKTSPTLKMKCSRNRIERKKQFSGPFGTASRR